MALRQITCPHCQQDVEVDVTSETRSHDCPQCGKAMVLELTAKQKRARRTTLMVPSVDPVEKLREAQHADHSGPRPLEGEVLDRMMHDPEVRRNLRRLIWGAAILAAVIVILVVTYRFESNPPAEPSRPSAVSQTTPSAPAAPSESVAQAKPDPLPPPTPVADPPIVAPPPAPTPATAPITSPVVVTTEAPPSDAERALQAVTRFLNAKDLEERLETIRDRSRIAPIMRAYYADHADGPIAFTGITPDPVRSPSAPARTFQVQLSDGQSRLATVGRVRSGDYFVDWASFVLHSEMEWDQFMQKRPTDPVFMRVLMAPASHHVGAFSDAAQYLCVKLTNPLDPASPPIYAYAGRTSPVGKSLNLTLQIYTGVPLPARLTLTYPPRGKDASTGTDQVLVEQLIGEGWLASGSQEFR